MNETERERSFNALLRRPSTRKQAEEFLSRQNLTDDDRESLMSEAEDTGLIDDGAFARLFTEGHLQWGSLKIAHELSVRGVSREDIACALEESEDESERAHELAESWRKGGIEERKIQTRLLSRGFTNRAIREALSKL